MNGEPGPFGEIIPLRGSVNTGEITRIWTFEMGTGESFADAMRYVSEFLNVNKNLTLMHLSIGCHEGLTVQVIYCDSDIDRESLRQD